MALAAKNAENAKNGQKKSNMTKIRKMSQFVIDICDIIV